MAQLQGESGSGMIESSSHSSLQINTMQPQSTLGRPVRSLVQTRIISLDSSDAALAEQYAPQLSVSGAGTLGINIKDADYPYSDYIPIDVNAVTSHVDKPIHFYLASDINLWGVDFAAGSYPVGQGSLDIAGSPELRQSENYLDFSPISVTDGYKSLTLTPTVYFRVFRDNTQDNPIAIQYWFFYFFNDWAFFDHLGDWETMTVFLNEVAQPVEAIYSTHHEANRYSWNNVNVSHQTHPQVFISNGGHGSYVESGATLYTIFSDNHIGDKESLAFDEGDYRLLDLKDLEKSNDSWIWFSGRWGSQNNAPQGPLYRIDVPSIQLYALALNPPFKSGGECIARFATKTYGDEEHYGPWYWAKGYGLDGESCQRIG